LVAGTTYSLKVYGRAAGVGTPIVASGTHTSNITAATGTVTVFLRKVDDEGTGTFSWNISLPTGANGVDIDVDDTATFTFVPLSDHAIASPIGDLDPLVLTTGTLNSTKTLNSGYYDITITVVKDGASHFPRVIEQRVQIYQGQTTIWDPPSIPALAPRTFTVELDISGNSNANPNPSPIGPIAWNDTITAPSNPTHSDGNFTFNNWRAGSITGFPWIFATYPVLGDFTLHADWTDITPPSLTISLANLDEYDVPTDPLATFATPLANVSGLSLINSAITTLTRTITIPNHATVFDNIEWFFNSSANSITPAVVGDDFTIEFKDPSLGITFATHHILLRATTTSGGVTRYWGIRIPVTITND
jgi:hypothetical protein